MEVMDIELKTNERLDNLGDNYYIIQNTESFLFGIDAVLLADFSSHYIKRKSKIVEIGSSTGIIPLLITKRTDYDRYDGFEIQEELVEIAKRNIKLNKIKNNLNIWHSDIRDLNNIKPNSYDILITNPPYFPNRTNQNSKRTTISPSKSIRIARNEVTLNLDDIFRFGKRVLKQGGKVLMVYRPERLSELVKASSNFGFEVKKLRFVYPSINKNANLVLIELTKEGKPSLIVEKPLIVYEDGDYTAEIDLIYEGISRKRGKNGK